MAKQATVTCTVMRVEPVNDRPFIFADVHIVCEACGQGRFMVQRPGETAWSPIGLAGHHLRPLVRMLQEVIDACPEETEEGEVVGQVVLDGGDGEDEVH